MSGHVVNFFSAFQDMIFFRHRVKPTSSDTMSVRLFICLYLKMCGLQCIIDGQCQFSGFNEGYLKCI